MFLNRVCCIYTFDYYPNRIESVCFHSVSFSYKVKVFGPSEEGPESHPIRLHAASFVFAYVNDHVRCPSEANEDSEVCGRLLSRWS